MQAGDRASENRQFHSKKDFFIEQIVKKKRGSLGTGGGQLLCPSLDKPTLKYAHATSPEAPLIRSPDTGQAFEQAGPLS